VEQPENAEPDLVAEDPEERRGFHIY
jgi:hypothetical protein